MAISGFYKEVLGTKLYIERNEGPENGAFEILCLHTAGRETRQYHRILELLEDKYQAYAFDMPGHGKSWPLPGNAVVKNHHDAGRYIWEVAQTLGMKRVVVIGCSLGGNLVYHMAQEYPVEAICSMQGGDFTHTDEYVLNLLDHPAVSVQHSHVEYTECLVGEKCPADVNEFILWGVCCENGRTKHGDLTIYAGYDVREKMKDITCPVLVILGLDDPSVPERQVKETMSRLTGTKKLVYKPVPGYGHFILQEAPEIIVDSLKDFLGQI